MKNDCTLDPEYPYFCDTLYSGKQAPGCPVSLKVKQYCRRCMGSTAIVSSLKSSTTTKAYTNLILLLARRIVIQYEKAKGLLESQHR